jgi:phosphate uptake regulator
MMRQAMIAEGKISKLRTALEKPDTEVSTEIVDALREIHRYVVLVERKCEEVEIQANRRRFHPF